MRKIILNLAVSLDGYIAGPKGEYDWCLTDDDYGMTSFLESVDTLLIGRKTFDLLIEYGDPYPDKTNYVFSTRLKNSDYKNVTIVNEDIISFADKLRKQDGKNIWLFGGAQIAYPLYDQNMIDQMVLSVHPVLLGGGIPLFRPGYRRNLKLTDCTRYPSGLVQLTYSKE